MDQGIDESIVVTDRRHPLFGKSFSIFSVSTSPGAVGHALILYAGERLLRIPFKATSLRPSEPEIPTKLTVEAIENLVLCLQNSEAEWEASEDVIAPDKKFSSGGMQS